MSKAIIELSTLDSVFTRSLALVKAIDAGESAPADYHLGFTDAGQLFAEFTGERCRLLDVLKATGAQSIYALAERLGRNYSNVRRDIQAMMAHGLIEKSDENKVYVPWDSVEIRVTLGERRAA